MKKEELRELLMRAYVRGWYDGLAGAKSDDRKFLAADEVIREGKVELDG